MVQVLPYSFKFTGLSCSARVFGLIARAFLFCFLATLREREDGEIALEANTSIFVMTINKVKIQRYSPHTFTLLNTRDYLNQLQQRTKWAKEDTNVTPGDLVLIKEDNMPPLCWPLGRVQAVHPGDNGVVHVVTVKTAKRVFKRATNRLSLLPMKQ